MSSTSSVERSPSALLTAVLALLSFVMPLATDMYLPAFPELVTELHTDASGAQLTLTSFLIGLAAGQLLFGPFSDRYGRRAPLLLGTGIAVLSTVLCAVAPSLVVLIGLRFVQGCSGAAGLVIGRAVVSDIARGAVAARLFSVLMTLGGVAPIAAPLAGGAVTGIAGWRGVFWALAAVTLVMFLAVLAAVPETLPRRQRRAAAGGGGTAVREVLSDRAYLAYMSAFAFAFAALFCYIAASPFFYQVVLELTVGQTSLAFAAGALLTTLSSAVSSRLAGKVSPEALLRTGLVLMCAAMLALTAVTLGGWLTRISGLGLLALFFPGLGLVLPNSTVQALDRVPHAAGVGSAVLGTVQTGFGAVVAPLMGLGGAESAIPMVLGMTSTTALAAFAVLLARSGSAGVPAAGMPSEQAADVDDRTGKSDFEVDPWTSH